MAEWFRRFTLSLFSDRRAKESVKFGFGNILLTCILSVVFIFFGIFAGKTVPFASYYNGAEHFRAFLHNAFATGITVTVNGGKAEIALNGQEAVIDTVANSGDSAVYSVNGYHLFVNSASVSETFDDFEAYCVNKEDGKTQIEYGEYLSMDTAQRNNYRFAVRYTGKVKEITAEDAEEYTAYLKGLDDGEINSKLAELEGTENYAESVYALYVQAYYPDMASVTGEAVPTLRTYYYLQTLKTDGNYLCLFGDMLIASFYSYSSDRISYGGIYKAGNGVADGADAVAVDKFIKNTFYDGASVSLLIDLVDSVPVIAITELIIVGAMLLGFAVCGLRKKGACLKFADSARIVASYSHTASFISAIVAFLLSFAFAGSASITAYVSLAVILVVRTAVLLLRENNEPAR